MLAHTAGKWTAGFRPSQAGLRAHVNHRARESSRSELTKASRWFGGREPGARRSRWTPGLEHGSLLLALRRVT